MTNERSEVVNHIHRRNSGFLLTEMVVSAMILGLITAALALSLYTFSRFNHYQLITQHCIAAAEAQLDSITATGKPIPDEDFERLWPKLTISVERSAGTGQWEGMNLAKVTAIGQSYRKKVKIQLSRYVRDIQAEEENTENNPPTKEDS